MAPRKKSKRLPSVRKLLKTSTVKLQNKLRDRAFRQRSADKQQRKQQRRLRQALRAVPPETRRDNDRRGGAAGDGGRGGVEAYDPSGAQKKRRKVTPADEDPHFHPNDHHDDDDDEEDVEEDVEEEQEDLELIMAAAKNSAFLSSRLDASPCPTKRRKKSRHSDGGGGDGLEAAYERDALRSDDGGGDDGKRLVRLLPVKMASGELVHRAEMRAVPKLTKEEDDDDDDAANDGEGPGGEEEEGGGGEGQGECQPPLVGGEDLARRRRETLEEVKRKIATLASDILADPHASLRKLRELRSLLDDGRVEASATVRKMAMLSLLEVFRDIAPAYRIRPLTAAEKATKVRKEVRELREFEEGLVQQYRCYLEFLEETIRDWRLCRRKRVEVVGVGAYAGLARVALRCLCQLLTAMPHFNFHRNVALAITPLAIDNHAQVSGECCEAIAKLFRCDRTGEASLTVVRLLTALVKSRNYNVRPEALRTLLHLRIQERDLQHDARSAERGARANRQRQQQRLQPAHSRMQRKWKKAADVLEKELIEADAMEGKERRVKLHKETLDLLFVLYFRILKNCDSSSQLLSPVLEGLSQFAHLINLDFFDDLLIVLHRLVESGSLKNRDSLHCILTAFHILSGQGEVLNIDPSRFYSHLYSILFRLPTAFSGVDVRLLLSCVEAMLPGRRRCVSSRTAQAFLKRLGSVALQLPAHSAVATIAAMRSLLLSFPSCSVLLDSDSSGSGCHLAETDEPEHSHAHCTALWEMHLLTGHYHPTVRQIAHHVLVGAPMEGRGSLPPSLSRRSPVELFDEFNPGRMTFNPPVQSTAPSRKGRTLPVAERVAPASTIAAAHSVFKFDEVDDQEEEVMDFWAGLGAHTQQEVEEEVDG